MNGVYIRQLDQDELVERMLPFLERNSVDVKGSIDREYLRRIVPLVRERLKTLGEAAQMTDYFFREEIAHDPQSLIQKGMDAATTVEALRRALLALSNLKGFCAESLEQVLRSAADELGLSGRQFFGALRVATTGKTAAPPLFETMEVLGKRRSLERIEGAVRGLEGVKK